VINFSFKSEFNVGRRVTNDITVSDISVSRSQASIALEGTKILVRDSDSKFGTFIRVNGLYEVVPPVLKGKCKK
jgi:pSer/pThr/pTyr-binding forkhead associated (FHA) protein